MLFRSYFGHLMQRADSLEKYVMLGKIEGGGEAGGTEDEMVGWHHQVNGHEFEQAPGDSEGQESLACCSPWGCKELDTSYPLNKNNKVLLKTSMNDYILVLFSNNVAPSCSSWQM